MDPKRKSILLRAARALVALLIGAAIPAAGSQEFRDFVGEQWWPWVGAAVPPLLLALDKWWRSWRT
ncbi:MAG: hypothetical protein ACM33U_09045 [Solirubrobacterales bacterium]|nr:hypothetical protein [Solirubrobacterales bacterium]